MRVLDTSKSRGVGGATEIGGVTPKYCACDIFASVERAAGRERATSKRRRVHASLLLWRRESGTGKLSCSGRIQ